MSIILENNKYFKKSLEIVKTLYNKKLYEDCINKIEKSAEFAWFNFSGYYRSNYLENILNKIGSEIIYSKDKIISKSKNQDFEILHISSELSSTGGHSKLLFNWIDNDTDSKHTIVSTRQTVNDLNNIIKNNIKSTESVNLFSVYSDSKIDSAKELNQLLFKGYDLIILHTHPDDVIINLVLSNPNLEIPVYMVNHADHVFWLGASVIDVLLQIRESNIKVDTIRRQISQQFFLPIPIENQEIKNIDEDSEIINILSTGSYYKYLPNEEYNFLEEMFKIASRYDNVKINIVGISSDSDYALKYTHDRIIYHGLLSHEMLNEIENKSDIYIEGFPMPSFTALLKPALKKIPFQLHYNASEVFSLFIDSENDYIIYPKNVEDWRSNIYQLIEDKSYRCNVTENQYRYVKDRYELIHWKNKIYQLYLNSKKLSHQINKFNDDVFLDGRNEEIVSILDHGGLQIKHFGFTENLNFINKLKVAFYSLNKNRNIDYTPGIKFYLFKN